MVEALMSVAVLILPLIVKKLVLVLLVEVAFVVK